MTTSPAPFWVHDGFTFDLTRAWHDVFGHRWEWTGETAADGPLMRVLTDRPNLTRTVMPLSEVYVMFGPLTPAPASITSDAVRAVLLDEWEVRDPACMACHDAGCIQCTRPPLPVRQPATAQGPKPDPLAYGPIGYRCGCGKPAHSNLTPCQPDSGDQADKEPKPAPAAIAPSPSAFARLLARLRGGTR